MYDLRRFIWPRFFNNWRWCLFGIFHEIQNRFFISSMSCVKGFFAFFEIFNSWISAHRKSRSKKLLILTVTGLAQFEVIFKMSIYWTSFRYCDSRFNETSACFLNSVCMCYIRGVWDQIFYWEMWFFGDSFVNLYLSIDNISNFMWVCIRMFWNENSGTLHYPNSTLVFFENQKMPKICYMNLAQHF